jgi:citrate synthase
MIVFWRDLPLTKNEEALVFEVEQAHRMSAFRENASTCALKNSAGGSGSFEMAVASAVLTFGGKHAPIEAIYGRLSQPMDLLLESVEKSLDNHEIVQGWGNSFFKECPDPLWESVSRALQVFPESAEKIKAVTELLHQRGKKLHPNPGAFTAITALILGIPPKVASVILIGARLPVWAALAQKEL